MNMTLNMMWGMLINLIGISEETLQIITRINGYTEQTMLDVLYAATGLSRFEAIEGFDDYWEDDD